MADTLTKNNNMSQQLSAFPRIAFITTINHNLGDDFVREGIGYLLSLRFGMNTTQYIHKHIPLTVRSEWEWYYTRGFSRILDKLPRFRGLFWSRIIDRVLPLCFSNDKIASAQLVVQSGAPVYWKGFHNAEWLAPLIIRRYASLDNPPQLINIGAGSCLSYYDEGTLFKTETEDANAIRMFHDFCSLTTVRDKLSAQILRMLDREAPVIPCPSLFARDAFNIQPRRTDYIAMNYMPLGGHYLMGQEINTESWLKVFRQLSNMLSKKSSVILICHDRLEEQAAAKNFPDIPHFRPSTAREALQLYSAARSYVGCRVHGAFAVASFGRPALVIGNDTRARMMEEIGLPNVFVNDAKAEVLYDMVCTFMHEQNDWKSHLDQLRDLVRNNYIEQFDKLALCK